MALQCHDDLSLNRHRYRSWRHHLDRLGIKWSDQFHGTPPQYSEICTGVLFADVTDVEQGNGRRRLKDSDKDDDECSNTP